MVNRGASMICIFLLWLALQAQAQGGKQSNRRWAASSEEEYVPVKRVVYRSSSVLPATATTEAAASYPPFEVCEGCRCCSPSNASSCVETTCCFGIDCNLPGKPFGTCAFTPHSCGCGGSGATTGGNCTQPS